MTIDWWTLALQAVNFLILAWLLQRFLYRPVLAAIDRRRAETVAAQDRAADAEHRAAAAERDWQARRKALDAEAVDLRRRAETEAARRAAEVGEAARAQADRLLADARAAIDAERRQAGDDLGRQAAGVAAALAGRLLLLAAPATGPAPFLALLADRLAHLTAGERGALAGGTLTVEVAPALAEAEQEGWRRRLLDALGTTATLGFAAAPELIAGARLVSPGAVLGVSWAEALAAAEREMSHAEPG
jgi:F-type H+-transporting ATPase subunit b